MVSAQPIIERKIIFSLLINMINFLVIRVILGTKMGKRLNSNSNVLSLFFVQQLFVVAFGDPCLQNDGCKTIFASFSISTYVFLSYREKNVLASEELERPGLIHSATENLGKERQHRWISLSKSLK